jgi:hypothetical protein
VDVRGRDWIRPRLRLPTVRIVRTEVGRGGIEPPTLGLRVEPNPLGRSRSIGLIAIASSDQGELPGASSRSLSAPQVTPGVTPTDQGTSLGFRE